MTLLHSVTVSTETVNTIYRPFLGSEEGYNYFLCFLLRVVPVVLEDDQSFSKRYKSTQVNLQFVIYELWSVKAIC